MLRMGGEPEDVSITFLYNKKLFINEECLKHLVFLEVSLKSINLDGF